MNALDAIEIAGRRMIDLRLTSGNPSGSLNSAVAIVRGVVDLFEKGERIPDIAGIFKIRYDWAEEILRVYFRARLTARPGRPRKETRE